MIRADSRKVDPGQRRLARAVRNAGTPGIAVAVVTTLFVSWLLALKVGGAGVVAPAWFYVPLVLCAYRFGRLPTFVVSVAAGLLSGPALPDHYVHGVAVAQATGDWVARAVGFVALGQMMAWLFRHLRRQRDAGASSLSDPLTGLANRVLFQDRLEHALARVERSGGVLGVLFLDLDNFKSVNDDRGHGAGDRLLVAVGERLRGAVRAGETLARLSGDEFAVMIERSDPSGPARCAERLVGALREPFDISGGTTHVHVSIGVASTDDGDISGGELLHNADVAMYAAKRAGKNRYHVYQSNLEDFAETG